MAEFGITFKNAREAKGLSLEQVADKTKIGTRFLEAIEKGEFERLPGGIFSRGFVKAYAESLGLDTNEILSSFDRLSNYRVPTAAEEPATIVAGPAKESTIRLYPIVVGVLVVLAIILYFATRQSTPAITASQAPSSAVAQKPAQPEKPPEVSTIQPAAPPADTSAVTPPASATPVATTALAPQPAKEALALVLEAKEETWVKVSADGSSVNPGEVLQPGTTRRYTAQNAIDLTVGNAGGVSVKVNDREIRSLGKGGQVRTITITPENLKDITD